MDENINEIFEVNGYHIVNLVKCAKAFIIEERFEEKIVKKEYEDIINYYSQNFEFYFDSEVLLKL